MSRRDYCIRRAEKVKKFSQRSKNPYYTFYYNLFPKYFDPMQSLFVHEFLVALLSDDSLLTKRDYQKTKNILLSKYGNTVEDVSSIEMIEYYRRTIDEKSLLYNPRVWKLLRKR